MQWAPASAQSLGDLTLPAAAYAPAAVMPTYTGGLTPAAADADYFKGFHSQTYTALGLSSAYLAVARWQPDAADIAYFEYQANVFPSAGTAFAAYDDAVKTATRLEGSEPSYCGMATDYACRW